MDEYGFFSSQFPGDMIEQGLSVAIGISQTKGIVKGDGRGGFEPCIPGEDYGYPVLTGNGAPDRDTAASLGQHYIDESATEAPFEYLCIGYSNDHGFMWQATTGMNSANPVATGSFRLNPKQGETKGFFSTAMGINCEATADYSHATGYDASAAGKAASAEGYHTNANGNYSHAEGAATLAAGVASHAEGASTAAYGENSHAEGLGTRAGSENQHVQGKHNIQDNAKKYAHIVGNGTENSLSNAHTLDWDGNAWFAGKVFVGGTGMDDPNAVELGTGGSGGGIDELLGDDGKIKPEFLPDIGGSTTVILPETEPVYSADMGAFVITSGIDASMFTDGQTYTVNWNGVEYETKALLTSFDGMSGITLGDVWILEGEPVTGEPFMIAVLDAASQAATGFASLIVPIDGSTSVTVSISGTVDVTTVILPPTETVYSEAQKRFFIMSGVDASKFTLAEKYTINYNGTDYECLAVDGSMMGISGLVALGNISTFVGGEDTGEPFVLGIVPLELQPEHGVAGIVIAFDGAASVTVSISGSASTADREKNTNVFVDIYGTIKGTYEGYGEKVENIRKRSHTNAEILALVKRGENVIIRNFYTDSDIAYKCYTLSTVDYFDATFTNIEVNSTWLLGSQIRVRLNGEMSMYERARTW